MLCPSPLRVNQLAYCSRNNNMPLMRLRERVSPHFTSPKHDPNVCKPQLLQCLIPPGPCLEIATRELMLAGAHNPLAPDAGDNNGMDYDII